MIITRHGFEVSGIGGAFRPVWDQVIWQTETSYGAPGEPPRINLAAYIEAKAKAAYLAELDKLIDPDNPEA